ncbi:MAG: hypothetical protein HC809_14280, partial [Gammaproteobacteria bacterium]|nr:hypothetical protein [Gammaproteobacteria bacterium]
MKSLDNILVVMDKPKHAQSAFVRALSLQHLAPTHAHLAAFVHHSMVDQTETYSTHQRNQIKKSMLRERTDWLRAQVLDAGAAFDNLSIEVVWTKALARWVTDRSAAEEFDLVIKSVHRTDSIMHTPTDWVLLRDCPVPLLLVSGRKWAKKPSILATLDLNRSDAAHDRLNRKVLDAANHFATTYGGVVHCVYAIETSRVLSDLDIIDPRKAAKKAKERIADHLQALIEPYGIPASRVHTPTGKVGQVVNGIA